MYILLFIVIVAGAFAWYPLMVCLGGPRCPSCKLRKAEVVSRKLLREEMVYFKVRESIWEYEKENRLWAIMLKGTQYTRPPDRVSVRERTLPGKGSITRWNTGAIIVGRGFSGRNMWMRRRLCSDGGRWSSCVVSARKRGESDSKLAQLLPGSFL